MAEGRLRSEWDRTASLMALSVNVAPFRKRGAKQAKPADFHPFTRRRARRAAVSVDRLATEIEKVGEARRKRRGG